MKPLSLVIFCLIVFFEASSLSPCKSFCNENKIFLSGKVNASPGNKPLMASLAIEMEGCERVELQSDDEGNFSVSLLLAPKITIIASASGYELQEHVLSVPSAKADTSLYISISLAPSKKVKLGGMIFDKKTSKPINAELDVYLDTDIMLEDIRQIDGGKYEINFTKWGWYLIEISSPGYITATDSVWIINDEHPDRKKDYYLIPLEAGLTVQLKNVKFYFGKSTLVPESYEELGSVVNLLNANPGLKLEIAGHTDSDGPDDYNLILSQRRAESVVNYLISQNIDATRILAKGYGESKPIDLRETFSAKSINRRVEFIVLEKDKSK